MLRLLLVLTFSVARAVADVDLRERYSGPLDYVETPRGHAWASDAGDVWSVSEFNIEWGDDLTLKTGPATLILGHRDRSALWAVVVPHGSCSITKGRAGVKEPIRHIWLRFHPAEINDLVPPATVNAAAPAGAETEKALLLARRVATWKVGGSWQAGNQPMVPSRGSVIVDIDTESARRFYGRDGDKIQYVGAFEKRGLPADRPLTAEQAGKAFDEVWDAYDREYAMFTIRKEVDWPALKASLLPKAEKASTAYELAAVLAELLAPLRDLHINVSVGNEWLPVFDRPRPLNGSWRACDKALGGLTDTKSGIAWARTDDGLGYINIYRMGGDEQTKAFDEVLDKLGDTWGLIVDLRFNGGGNEMLGRAAAGRFADKSYVYSKNQYRAGPKHDELGKVLDRTFEPRGPWRYQSPIVVLWGRRTMSSAESFALMLAQLPQATTMGDNTAGSSANPRQVKLDCGVTVTLPRWIDLDPSGKPIDEVGIAPQKKLEADESKFTAESDPVLDAALVELRKRPVSDRKPGKRV